MHLNLCIWSRFMNRLSVMKLILPDDGYNIRQYHVKSHIFRSIYLRQPSIKMSSSAPVVSISTVMLGTGGFEGRS